MASTASSLNRPEAKYDYPETDDPKVIKSQIEHTRSQMGETIDAIQYKLAPERLAQQAKDTLKTATIGKVEEMASEATYKANNWRSSLIRTVKENPMPSALIGIGLGWLLFSNNEDSNDYDRYYYPPGDPSPYVESHQTRYFDQSYPMSEQQQPTGQRVKHNVKEAGNQAAQKASAAAENVQQTAANVASSVKQSVSQAANSVTDAVSSAQDTTMEHSSWLAERARDNTYHYSRRAKRTAQEQFYDNPLAAGAVAIAAGALVGMLVPTTQKEHELMGETRDSLLEQAQEKVKDTVDKAQNVVEEVQQTATEKAKAEAKKQGLTTK